MGTLPRLGRSCTSCWPTVLASRQWLIGVINWTALGELERPKQARIWLVGATSLTAGVVGVNSCQAASIKPRNATFNDGGVPKGNFTLYHAWGSDAEGRLAGLPE